jgi:hypothetical protein
MALDVEKEDKEEQRRTKVKDRIDPKSIGEEKTVEESLSLLTSEEKKLLSEWKGKEGQKIRFEQDLKDLGVSAGESGKIEDINSRNAMITLRMEDGRHVRMLPEFMREMEKENRGEGKSQSQKTVEQGKEETKEENKEVSKKRGQEKDPFRDRPEERLEEKKLEEKKENPRVERQRVRDGMGY